MSFYCGKLPQWVPAVFFGALLLASAARAEERAVILAFGDSLTAGYGVKESESYPALLQDILKQNGYPHRVINAGVSGDTTAGGVRRIDWLLKHRPEIVILELGANDGLRGLPLDEMAANLQRIIEACRHQNAKVLLAGMKLPPNYGETYTHGFENIFPRLAKQNQIAFIPFFLDKVAAIRNLTMPDGIHPLAEGYKIVAQTVWRHLEPMLEGKKAGR